jgi:hypothetical protein
MKVVDLWWFWLLTISFVEFLSCFKVAVLERLSFGLLFLWEQD